MRRCKLTTTTLLTALAFLGCAGGETVDLTSDQNPFLVDQTPQGKADTHYMNPDGVEVEVDLEADIEAPEYRLDIGPAVLGQFAMTHLRKQGSVFLESLAEDAGSKGRVEWLVDGQWVAAGEVASADSAKRKHFRIRGVNAVLLHEAREGADVGKVFEVPVPKKPFSIMADAGETCGEVGGHIGLSQSVYWYLWEPDKAGCKADLQNMKVTLSKLLPSGKVTYPEYDLLTADKKITVVILFGQIGDGAITESDPGMRNMAQMASWLKDAKFKEATSAPVGKRFSKAFSGVTLEIDLYSPNDFSGLGDFGHFDNFQKALSEHEIVAYDGHSMLGASDFWAKPKYPDFYQIYLYGGCLGYEYYVRPIINGKGGWDKVDILSSVVEVSADANDYAGPFLAKLTWALEHDFKVSWRDMVLAIRDRVGDSTFGVSGVRENCFSPGGSLCAPEPPPGTTENRFEDKTTTAIPDADKGGVERTIEVPEGGEVGNVTVELDVSHSYVSDLRITLSHGGVSAVVWDHTGGSATEIVQAFSLDAFKGLPAGGTWTLKLADTEAEDEGTLRSWALVLAAP